MRVFIAGGSGLIGSQLAHALLQDGHHPVILSRNADQVRRKPEMKAFQVIQGEATKPGRWQDEVDGCDAVVNVAGHNIFADRWTAEIKRQLRDSRVHSASQLVAAVRSARVRPQVFVQGSAVGFYGIHGDEAIDESGPSGAEFLAVVCRECEDVSAGLETEGVRRAIVRTGIVLAPGEGAIKIMKPLFQLGPGVPVGSAGGLLAQGGQWMSWIHIDDIVGIFRLALENAGASGPINGTAPEPVTNAEFARTFSGVLRKWYTPWRAFIPFGPPDAFLRMVLGDVAGVITTGQKVLPAKALALGYRFKYPALADALRSIVEASPAAPKPPAVHAHPTGAHAHH